MLAQRRDWTLEWNAQRAATHNPPFAKATGIGDFYVNGKAPPLNGYF